LTAKKWKKDRKALNPGFGFQYFDGFLNIFNEQSEIMVDILESEVAHNDTNLLPFITRCTLDSVFSKAIIHQSIIANIYFNPPFLFFNYLHSDTVLGAKRNLQRNPNEQIAEKIYGYNTLFT